MNDELRTVKNIIMAYVKVLHLHFFSGHRKITEQVKSPAPRLRFKMLFFKYHIVTSNYLMIHCQLRTYMYECHENAEEYSHIFECIMQILPGGNEKN